LQEFIDSAAPKAVAATQSAYSLAIGVLCALHCLNSDRHVASDSKRAAAPWIESLFKYQRYQIIGDAGEPFAVATVLFGQRAQRAQSINERRVAGHCLMCAAGKNLAIPVENRKVLTRRIVRG
jgi:hypothetical protein